jgi:hypothetical protein
MACSSCLKHAAKELGFDDVGPLLVEIGQLREQLAATGEDFESERQQRIDADTTIRVTNTYERLLGGDNPNPPPGRKPSKRPRPKD